VTEPVKMSVTLGRVQTLGVITHLLCRKGTGNHLDVPLQERWQGAEVLEEAKQDTSLWKLGLS